MNINTKFDIGERVYFFDLGQVIDGVISSIDTSIYNVDHILRIKYLVKYHPILLSIPKSEGQLFSTKEELIRQL